MLVVKRAARKGAGHGTLHAGHGRPTRRLRRGGAGGGVQASDFELQEEAFDPQTAEVEARKGSLGVRHRRTEAVAVYPLGDGSDWVAGFAADLAGGRFGGLPRR